MRTVMSSADKGFWALSEKGLANARCCLSSIEDASAQYLGLLEAFSGCPAPNLGQARQRCTRCRYPCRRDFSARRGRCARSLPVLTKPEPQKWRNSPPAMDLTSETPAIIEFGHFRVVPHRRELLADGQPIHLGGRTFDMLMALIEEQGAVVAKDTLMERVWPNRIVEENSLHFQISALRDALGAERSLIRTISGRGYQFTGEIRTIAARPQAQAVAATAATVSAARSPTNLPEPVS